MKHVGDIQAIHGYDLEPVDVICGGSPCQNLSVAGRREGLAGQESSLFFDQIRIIKEMREHDKSIGRANEHIRPRFCVWENVRGASSSNAGQDFATVIEEFIRIVEPDIPEISVPDGGWPASGCFYDDMGRWSLAWRVHDARLWGLPQRRTRIALVVDFGGLTAPEVLFERKGLTWDPSQS